MHFYLAITSLKKLLKMKSTYANRLLVVNWPTTDAAADYKQKNPIADKFGWTYSTPYIPQTSRCKTTISG